MACFSLLIVYRPGPLDASVEQRILLASPGRGNRLAALALPGQSTSREALPVTFEFLPHGQDYNAGVYRVLSEQTTAYYLHRHA